MKSRFFGVGAMALVLGFSMAGCAKNSVLGKWTGSIAIAAGAGMANAVLEFKPDGTDIITMSRDGRTVVINETYTVSNNNITENITSMSLNGRTISLPSKPETYAFKVEGDKLTLTPPGSVQPVVLTRVNQ